MRGVQSGKCKDIFAAVIQARLSSKRCPGKMLRNFAGTNFTEIALKKFAQGSDAFTFYFAAHEKELIDVAKKYGCPIIKRNKMSAQGENIRDVMNYLEAIEEPYIVFINACSPFLTLPTVKRAIETFVANGCLSLTAVAKRHTWYYTMAGLPVNLLDPTNLNTKTTQPLYEVTHNIHIFNKERFLRFGYFWENKPKDPYLFEIDEEEAMDIDSEFEFALTEAWYKVKNSLNITNSDFQDKIKKIQLLISDVDGVLTDGGMYYSKKGEYAKKFNTRDGMGIRMMRQLGIEVAVISGENTKIVEGRMRKLNIRHVFMGVTDKLKVVRSLSEKLKIPLDNIAYVGDDINDIPAMENVCLAITVADAADPVKGLAHYITRAKGGDGALREICNIIVRNKCNKEYV